MKPKGPQTALGSIGIHSPPFRLKSSATRPSLGYCPALPLTLPGVRCRGNSAHVRQSKPDFGLGFQTKVLNMFEVGASWLESGCHIGWRSRGVTSPCPAPCQGCCFALRLALPGVLPHAVPCPRLRAQSQMTLQPQMPYRGTLLARNFPPPPNTSIRP